MPRIPVPVAVAGLLIGAAVLPPVLLDTLELQENAGVRFRVVTVEPKKAKKRELVH